MRIKRFFASEMREAIRIVREAFGPDAVILSNRKTPDGVEVVAAVDYEDAVAAGYNDSPLEAEAHGSGSSWVEDSDPPDAQWSSDPAVRPQGLPTRATARRASEAPSREPRTGTRPAPGTLPGTLPSTLEESVSGLSRPAGSMIGRYASPPFSEPPLGRDRVNGVPTKKGGAGESVFADVVEGELRSLRQLLEQQVSSLAWADFGRQHPARAANVRRLMQLGLTRTVADPVAAAAHEGHGALGEDGARWRGALGHLARRVRVVADDVLATGGVVALLGPTGVGKTTTIAKLAARYRMRNGANSAALLTTDNYRVGAQEQLRNYGQLMGLPMAVCGQAEELHDAIERYRDRRLILIDTAGMSQRDIRLAEQAALIRKGADGQPRPLSFYLVLSAATQYSTLDGTVRAFGEIPLDGCVITKVDEATSLGEMLSVLIEHALPAAYLCDGQRVPEDMSRADAKQLVVRAAQFARRAAGRSDEALEMLYGGVAAHG